MHTTLDKAEPAALVEAMRILDLKGAPDVHWLIGDDQCDCLFQRIFEIGNPYVGRTHRVRLCCIWADIYKQYPQFVQELPYYDANRDTYTAEPAPWDSDEMDMPVYLWWRQLAIKEGKSLAEIRREYAGREHERPKKSTEPRQHHPIAEVKAAIIARLRRSGWLLPGDPDPDVNP